ncbi:Long-chain fatty acid transport protein [Pustulibacterium marinum]|uniref:Long-chain fatty acid transport protein n=1 Tax=Pustulibacterium marinum TaxID=1224947 RepID=A0A1I7FDJ6_9FLAO|nr:outer membrane protein transport protein [Pustulibacterium marinum]SFU34238.1 Long-chain fatty acid transport protein [Pustulibacterium marinum]
MKKFAFLFIMVTSVAIVNAQDITDALRYSSDELSGSARVRSMSGAFGALGGDISSITINPAGSAVMLTSEAGLTIGNYNTQNENTFFGNNTSDTKDQFDLSQAGVVLVYNNTDQNAKWGRMSLGFNYENSNNYSNRNFIKGLNTNNGIDKYFLAYAQGVSLENIDLLPNETVDDLYQWLGENYGFAEQQAFLGYQAYIIDPVSSDNLNSDYNSNAYYTGLDQEYTLETKGANRKFTVNFATEYDKKLYLGINLNFHSIDLKKETYLSEIGFDADSPLQETGFKNYLETYGNGFSLQAGAIYKATKNLRLGAVYQSPTWYRINEELSQGVFGISIDENGNEYSPDVVYPNVTNIYEAYKLTTPGKFTGSLSYVFGKAGLLSFDYIRKDYSNTKFRPVNDAYFSTQNNQISNSLQATNSYRLGGEARIERLSLRAGYRFEESPYKNESTVGDLTGYSFGFGYNFGATTLDLSYDIAEQDSNYQLYSVGLTDSAAVNSKFQTIMLSLNFKI